MAGRRLNNTVATKLQGSGIDHVVLAGYANEYTQYVATKEEYDQQHYEGASTLFGPYTLQAYQQEYGQLAQALSTSTPVSWTASLPASTAPSAKRVSITNNYHADLTLEFYLSTDDFCASPLRTKQTNTAGKFDVPSGKKRSFLIKDIAGIGYDSAKVRFSHQTGGWGLCPNTYPVQASQHIIVESNGNPNVTSFQYQHPTQTDTGPYTPPANALPGYTNLQNRWKSDRYIHIQHGQLESGGDPQPEPGWHSAQWKKIPVAGTSYFRLQNRWKPEQHIHIENGQLESGLIHLGWHSAQWVEVSGL